MSFHFFSQLTLLSHLAAFTGEMTLGTNLVLLPLHPPVDVAEQVALIDQLCGGRFIMTVGQGYRVEEFDAFGSPHGDRLARFIDGVEIIRRLWAGEAVDHETPWYSLTGAAVRPLPAQPDGVPIWIGASSDRAIRRAGGMADAFMAMPNATSVDVQHQMKVFAEGRDAAGIEPAADAGRLLEVFCHRDSAQARALAEPHLLMKYAAYAAWGVAGGDDAAGATEDDEFAALAADRFVIGDPDEVVAGLVAQHRDMGMTHLAMRVTWPGSDTQATLDCIELLGTEVLPRVRAELA